VDVNDDILIRAERHAAVGEPTRLAILEDLVASDRTPSEIARRFDLPTNLLAHHLNTLERAGLIGRTRSSGDGRRRYVRADHRAAADLGIVPREPVGPVLFVCTHNSARSQLAAALWEQATGEPAGSAGTHPAERVQPGAVAAARRAGLDLAGAVPRSLDGLEIAAYQVITVCDRAHEELDPVGSWWHWSVPDPVPDGRPTAYDAALRRIDERIQPITGDSHRWN
jgi:protein-tyrosine-phosphatase